MALIVATIVVSEYRESGEPRWQAESYAGGNTERVPVRVVSAEGARDAAVKAASRLPEREVRIP